MRAVLFRGCSIIYSLPYGMFLPPAVIDGGGKPEKPAPKPCSMPRTKDGGGGKYPCGGGIKPK